MRSLIVFSSIALLLSPSFGIGSSASPVPAPGAPVFESNAWGTTRAHASATTTPAMQARRTAPTRRPARTPVVRTRYTSPRSSSALLSDLSFILTSRTRHGQWGAMVISLSRGDTLFSWGPDIPMMPASTMKLFTAAIAFEELGPEHTFSTDVLRDGALDSSGTLTGNLILRGDGDPALSSRFLRGGPDAPMTLLAQLTAGAGVRRVTGDLVADASGFENRRIPEGWQARYLGSAYAAPFSALSLNENVVIIAVSPNRSGQAASVSLQPATRGMTVTNTVRTVAGRGVRVSARRVGDDRVLVSGTIGAAAGTMRYQLVVGDPVTFTVGAYRAALEAAGVVVDGAIRVGRTPADASIVTSLPSPPLARIVSVMNRESINHYAEMVWRNAARGTDRSGFGSAESAFETLNDFLTSQVGISDSAVVATDGSGLSVLDRATPRSLVQLLAHAHNAPWASAFHASLPVAGESELLRNRMRATPAAGNLHAKTGTTNDVIGLAGYVTAENGEILAFSLLYNGRDRWAARETIDIIGPTLAGFWRE